MRLRNKNVIITGASRGIGRAIAVGFATEGARQIITYQHQREAANQLVHEIANLGGTAKALQLDICNNQLFDNFIHQATEFLGEINVLINNAGIIYRTAYLDTTEDQFDKIMDVNIKGPFLFTQKIANLMKEQNKGGSIINISSISDEIVAESASLYQISKAALSMFTRSIALELAKYGIRVNTLSPGLTETDINKEQRENQPDLWHARVSQTPLRRAGIPQDHVGAAIFLASDESAWTTGSRIAIDGGRSLF